MAAVNAVGHHLIYRTVTKMHHVGWRFCREVIQCTYLTDVMFSYSCLCLSVKLVCPWFSVWPSYCETYLSPRHRWAWYNGFFFLCWNSIIFLKLWSGV